jgi:hypothetical protein
MPTAQENLNHMKRALTPGVVIEGKDLVPQVLHARTMDYDYELPF